MQVSDKNVGTAVSRPEYKGNLQGTSEEFLQMFVAQLKNQDPTDPMDSKDMISNIAQLNEVSYLEKMKDSLEILADKEEGIGIGESSSLIGKEVAYSSTFLPAQGNGTLAQIDKYSAGMAAAIVDRYGNKVQDLDIDQSGWFRIPDDKGSLEGMMLQGFVDGEPKDISATFSSNVKEVNVMNGEVVLDNGSSVIYDNIIKIGIPTNE